MSWEQRLWGWRKWLFWTGIGLGIIIGIIVGYTTSNIRWGSISGVIIAIVPNVITVYGLGKGIAHAIKLGWKQAELNILEKQRSIQRLLKIDQWQRDHIYGYFKSYVESVNYKGLATTAPHVVLRVKFFNLSVFECKITHWKLHFERDDSQMNCMGKVCQLRPQGGELEAKIEACKSTSIDMRLDIEAAIVELIKESSINKNEVHFHMHIDWQIELEEIGTHAYRDYLSYTGLPNLAV